MLAMNTKNKDYEECCNLGDWPIMETTAVQSYVEAALTQTLQIRELYSSNLGNSAHV